MPKHSGTTNYSMADADQLLALVEKMLPLGRDEWERLAMTFNVNRPRGSLERDFESLRRKVKVVHSTRKLTGVQEMPPLVQKAKEVKRAIYDKANVVEMDDEADNDQPTTTSPTTTSPTSASKSTRTTASTRTVRAKACKFPLPQLWVDPAAASRRAPTSRPRTSRRLQAVLRAEARSKTC
ncbi:hypothetical protein PF005_g6671 [Phytophthora fragariae]|nr:hypothetical protein PF003_g123 [Phytophthora fragariae]KAE8947008.1 hypothetical protein PF009_g3370 [Phytophthora fragariae]KAE9022608.1 hypothetical protein PF011_g4371 [Phytophthora fragariae]KAE9124451.1 hypothetical protein PF010_g6004 [Phytophthora fragariae]KAE9147918.1 hypothetical protein PF006_g7453 [Phytophthora fragariae]